MNQKGFANIILVVVIVILAGAVGYFVFLKKSEPVAQEQTASQTTTPTKTPISPTTTPQNKNQIVYDNKNSIESNGYKFWEALSRGDISEFSNFYADEVWLLGGSELLKNEWGLNLSGDSSKDLLLKKSEILNGYKQMIDLLGKDKWVEISSRISPAKISFSSAKESKFQNENIEEEDIIMQVPTNSQNVLLFVLRPINNQDVKVVMELTDY